MEQGIATLSPAETQKYSSPYKQTLDRLLKNPFKTDFSQKQFNKVHDWVEQNQAVLQNKFKELNNQPPPNEFVLVLHGSVARGNANQEKGSDKDGTIWCWLDNVQNQNLSGIESVYPEKDWGIRILNVKELMNTISFYDQKAGSTQFPDRKQMYRMISGPLASLFGPSSIKTENKGLIDDWRKKVIETIDNLKSLSPDGLWEIVQEDWENYFINSLPKEGRENEAEDVIKQKLSERNIPPEKIYRGVNLVQGMRSNQSLPSFDEMKKTYQVTKVK